MKKFSVFDLFAGAGGFGLGFSMAGYNLLFSLEKDDWAVDTLEANSSNDYHFIKKDDIRKYKHKAEILDLINEFPDVIIGGPPCQGFSLAGPAKDPKDPRNSLFYFYARWVSVFQPKVFVMENVTGLLLRKNSNGDRVIDIIQKVFQSKGYKTEVWVLNAADYGVPQLRTRIFIVGNKYGKTIGPPLPTHQMKGDDLGGTSLKKAVTVWDAISDLPYVRAGEGQECSIYKSNPENSYQEWARTESTAVFNHVAMKHTRRTIERFATIQQGLSKSELPEHLQVRKRNGNGELSFIDYNSNYRLLNGNYPSPTIPASFYSNFIHPNIPRNITSREAARIQSFPDWYIFKGYRTMISSSLLRKMGKVDLDHLSQYNQIGNAVPPLLAKAIATRIREFLFSPQTVYYRRDTLIEKV